MRESARARSPKTKEGRGTSETRPARVSSRSISSLLETNQSFSQGNEIYCEYIYIHTHNATLEHEDGARNIRFTIRNQMYAFVLPIAFSGNHRSPYSFRKEKCSRYSAKYAYIYTYVCIRANWSASITTNSRLRSRINPARTKKRWRRRCHREGCFRVTRPISYAAFHLATTSLGVGRRDN